MTTQPTLAQRLHDLPLSGVTFRQRRDETWIAYWTAQGAVQSCELGADEHGMIAREQRRRQRLAHYSPPEPRPKYSRAEPEPETCDHAHPVIWCAVCRERMREEQRRAGRRKTA